MRNAAHIPFPLQLTHSLPGPAQMSQRAPPSPSNQRPVKMAKMNDAMDLSDAVTATQAIPSYRPDAKARRYDRQLRLWASAGQRSLEAAKVLLIGCDATGCQALKNLVLPGIAHFTILSPRLIEPQDIATNFFLHSDSVGLSIAEEAVKLLKELNPAVEGAASTKNPEDLLADPTFFSSFTLIIASNIDPKLELALAESLWMASETVGGPDVPLICIRDSGFIGRIEIQLREHCVSDTHPEQTHTLRVDQPFPALEKMARELDFDNMDSMEHSHVPWVVILARAVSVWREQYGSLPNSDNDEDRAGFKDLIKSWRRKADEENFDEALRASYQGFTKSELDPNLAQLFEDPAVQTVSDSSKNLHILLHALKQYTADAHLPPISPTLPDMHSSTTSYVALQNLYRAQFNQDFTRFKEILAGTLEQIGLPEDAIPAEEVENFARNSGGVQVIKGRPLRESKEFKGLCVEVYGKSRSCDADADEQPDDIHLGLHLALLASEKYHMATGRWPGSTEADDLQEENRQVEEAVAALGTSLDSGTTTNCIAEVIRGGFATLPNTAAFLGGIVAQEAIKLVTNQYMPLDNTVVVDLVRSTMEKYKF